MLETVMNMIFFKKQGGRAKSSQPIFPPLNAESVIYNYLFSLRLKPDRLFLVNDGDILL